MSEKVLLKDNWSAFVQALASSRKVWAPEEQTVRYASYSEGDAPAQGYVNTTVPPKSLVFPQTETMFKFALGELDYELPGEAEERVALGVRPCDARAMEIVDSLFAWDFIDGYYQDKRAKTAVIGMACNEPCINCFCTSVGGGPASTEGLDILMVDVGDSYLLRAVTDKGEAILAEAAGSLQDVSGEDKKSEEVIKEAEGKIIRNIDISGIAEKLPGIWEDALWQRVSNSCLGCGTCTYLCPTCHCFDIQDEVEGSEGRRCRMWDSCMFEEYTLHTSGHNTRPTRRERTRNRINHKYNYFVQKFGKTACVGCGRCINHCPVNIDILDILSQVKEAL